MRSMDKVDAAYEKAMDAHHPGWRDLPWHERPSIDGAPKGMMDTYVARSCPGATDLILTNDMGTGARRIMCGWTAVQPHAHTNGQSLAGRLHKMVAW